MKKKQIKIKGTVYTLKNFRYDKINMKYDVYEYNNKIIEIKMTFSGAIHMDFIDNISICDCCVPMDKFIHLMNYIYSIKNNYEKYCTENTTTFYIEKTEI